MRNVVAALLIAGFSLSLLAACVASSVQRKASVLEYLYPKGTESEPPRDVTLDLPLRVGIAFAPSSERHLGTESFDATMKQDLLERIAQAFRGAPEIQSVDVIPSHDLQPAGGFENLDQIAAMHGLDVMALVSYEQVQFDEPKKSSVTYWTIVGAYVVEGNQNETRTLLDAAVFDIRSRTLLFRASGSRTDQGSSTAVEVSKELRDASRKGFERATDELIASLQQSLKTFREQTHSGTVRGLGTPAVTVLHQPGSTGGGSGAGALGAVELALGALLLVSALGRGRAA